jgi:peptidoglycan/LPS O-acetylase OafA/YrhL
VGGNIRAALITPARQMAKQTNNFNLLRLIFAMAVLYMHSYSLVGAPEPVIWRHTIGNVAVHGFFVLSGYLISRSFTREPNLAIFGFNRVLRIVPGLVIALVFTHYVALYFDHFATNPTPYIANGPIWTLTWESICYVMVAVLGIAGALGANSMPAIVVLAWLAYLVRSGDTSQTVVIIVPILLEFLMGAFIAARESTINMKRAGLMAVAVFALLLEPIFSVIWEALNQLVYLGGVPVRQDQIYNPLYLLAFPFFVIAFGKALKPLPMIENDLSYGIYIYAWPVQQALVFLAMKHGYAMGPIGLFVGSTAITVCLAFLSWTLIERNALRLKIHRKKNEAVSG